MSDVPTARSTPADTIDADDLLRRIAELEARLSAQRSGQNVERQQRGDTDLRSANLLRMAAETARIITWEWDVDQGDFQWGTNPEGLLGPKPDTGDFPAFLEMVHPADVPDLIAGARAALASGDGFVEQFRLSRTDGEQRWILMRAQVSPNTPTGGKSLIGIAIDNHERRKAEYQSERLSRQYRALLDNLPDLAWTKDLEGRFTAVNLAFAANVGLEPGELIGKLDSEVLPANALANVREQERQVIETRQTLRWEQPYFLRDQQGWAEIVKSPVLDRAGNVIGVVGTSHDLTQRKEAEIELAASEKRFRDFAELSADWYWKQDADLRMLELTENGVAPAPWTISYGKRRWEIPGIDLSATDWDAHKADLEARRPSAEGVHAPAGT